MPKIPIDLKSASIKEEQKSNIIVGIDLGTTNSIVSIVENGSPKVIKAASGSSAIMPSLVYFDKQGNIKVGDEAKAGLINHPERTIYSFKRLLGKSFEDLADVEHQLAYNVIETESEELVKVEIDGKFYNPIELSAEVLKKLKQHIENYLDQTVEKAVITVPAYFNDAQRQATRDAGKIAGLDVLRIVNEPTAASLAYGIDADQNEGQTIAVYDLGGGTFDISILSIEGGVFEVLSSAGDTWLGGDDFDRAIVEFWLTEDPTLKDLYQQDKSFIQELRLLAEKAKKALSDESSFSAEIRNTRVSINREKFDALIAPLIEGTVAACKIALKDAKLTANDIDHVIMVGGSTRVLAVQNAVADFFNQSVNNKLDPDLVVAMGAAIQADILAGNRSDILLLDITPLSLGIETVGGLMDVIIPRNTKIPARFARKYTTSVDGQVNLKVSVYQGERDLVEHNRKLASFILKDIPPMPAGIPQIEIQFILDADGILQVKARENRSDKETHIEVKPTYGISEEEMALMLKDSITHAEEDMQKKALIEAQTEAQNVVQATEKFIEQNRSFFKPSELAVLGGYKDQLKTLIADGSKDEIQQAMQDLNTFAQPLAHEAMDKTISEAMGGKKL